MKVLGHDSEGGAIIVLTCADSDALALVQEAMESQNYRRSNRQLDDGDVKTLFYLMTSFATARFMISDFERTTAKMKDWLLTVEGGSDE